MWATAKNFVVCGFKIEFFLLELIVGEANEYCGQRYYE